MLLPLCPPGGCPVSHFPSLAAPTCQAQRETILAPPKYLYVFSTGINLMEGDARTLCRPPSSALYVAPGHGECANPPVGPLPLSGLWVALEKGAIVANSAQADHPVPLQNGGVERIHRPADNQDPQSHFRKSFKWGWRTPSAVLAFLCRRISRQAYPKRTS